METETFIEELASALSLPDGTKLEPSTRFREESWWDSLALLTTLAVFDASYGKQLAAEDLKSCETLDDIAKLGQAS